jgi:hypothetical protein
MTKTKLNCIAHVVIKPKKTAPFNFKGASKYLDENRAGIVKLRRRGFSWGQISQTFDRLNIPVNYNNLYQWQLRNFRQRKNTKSKVNTVSVVTTSSIP